MSEPILVERVHKSFGEKIVLADVGVEVSAGSVFGLVGLNGAGKTTLFRILLGLLRPDQGTVRILGNDPWRHDRMLFRRTGVVLEHDGFWANLTFSQNLDIFSRAKGMEPGDVREYLDRHWSGLIAATEGKKSKHWSRGQRMQAALCRAFLGWPRVCLLDEPGIALDVDAFDLFEKLVAEARSRECAVVISSHQLESIEKLADTVGVLRDGALRLLETEICREWVLRAVNNEMVPAIVFRELAAQARFDGEVWRFSLTDPERVPSLVRALVAAGIDIREIRPTDGILRTRIRSIGGGDGL